MYLWTLDKEELIKFRKSSASGSGSKNFLKYSSTLRNMALFPQFASCLWKTWADLLWKILSQMYPWTRNWVLLNFGSRLDDCGSRFLSPDPEQTDALAEVCTLWVLTLQIDSAQLNTEPDALVNLAN